jgi:hypothetical protein
MLQLTQDGGSSRSGDVAGHHWHSTSRGIARIPFSSGGAQEAKGERGSESVVGKRRRRRSETGSKEPRRLALQLRLAHPVARLLLALLLLTLMACRPCHGHDPELFDMDDEDGKFHKGINPFFFFYFFSLPARYFLLDQTKQQLTHLKSFIILFFYLPTPLRL